MSRNPLMVHKIVRMVHRANRIAANPYVRTGLRFEDSVVFRDEVRFELKKLGPAMSHAVHLLAEGHTMQDAAYWSGLSARMIERTLEQHAMA